jgi:hypothetical protein
MCPSSSGVPSAWRQRSAPRGGHFTYGTGSICADKATVAFLTKGILPAKDLSCDGPQS